MPLRPLAVALLAFSLVSGCAAGPVGGSSAARDRIDGEHIFTVGYNRISEIYLDPVDLRRLTLDGLGGLIKLDPAISLLATEQVLHARVNDKVVGEFVLPGRNEAGAWAEVTARVLERLRAHSASLSATTREDIYQAVFDAIVADLDAYSRYTSASRALDERSQREGYGGIGVVMRHQPGRHEIAEVMLGGPAAQAGVRTGDLVLAIDGTFTADLAPDAVGDRLRGPAGTVVMLTVGPTLQDSRRLMVRRDRVIPNTVEARAEGRIGIVRIDRFNAATALNLREALRSLRAGLGPQAAGFILDLRGNPGGLLDQAVAVADQFIRTGRIISTQGRHPDSMQRFDATPDDQIDGLPLVVLVDGRSASAAEIVAAALQDTGRAVVVGASSFGKGSVQTVTRLPNDGELFLTWSRLYAPSGYTLHKQGVQPTVCTSNDVRNEEEALRSVRLGAVIPASTMTLWRTRAPEDSTALAQLREACPWKEHAPELDLTVARSLLMDPVLYRRALQMAMTNLAER